MSMQGTEEWLEDRRGKITASNGGVLLVNGRNQYGLGDGAITYAAQLAAERLGVYLEDGYDSYAMKRGKELEPESRLAYQNKMGCTVWQPTFKNHPTISYLGASADGIIVKDEGVFNVDENILGMEIKCRSPYKHLMYFINDKITKDEMVQCQLNMECWSIDEWDFVSYNPDIKDCPSLYIKRLYRDESMIENLLERAEILNGYVEMLVNKIKQYGRDQQAA